MGRPKGDQKYWNEVEIIEENKKWKCKHCGVIYRGGFSRIKAHLDKTKKKGVAVCTVYKPNQGAQHINASNSIDPQEDMYTLNQFQAEGIPGTSDTTNHQANIQPSPLLGVEVSEHSHQMTEGPNEMIHDDMINHPNNTRLTLIEVPEHSHEMTKGPHEIINDKAINYTNNITLTSLEAEGIPGTSDTTNHQANIQPSPLLEVEVPEHSHQMTEGPNEMIHDDMINHPNNARLTLIEAEFGDLIVNSGDELLHPHALAAAEVHDLTVESPLSSNESPNDSQFYENVEEMWSLLRDREVLMIGIHGMGGVGKTFLATHMERAIKSETEPTFKNVFRVTVSHDFTILKLQHHIAQTIGFKLEADYDDTGATILAYELGKLGKAVLILDDVWKYIDLQKLGIPLEPNGIKLIIITRLKHVCRQMDCPPRNIIEMRPLPLSGNKAWELFLVKLGHPGTPATLSPLIEKIARSLVKACDGLPLGISVMARTFKGREDDIVWWRRALHQFENLEMGQEMTEDVLTVLKRSFDNLIEEDMKKSFLYFSLLPNFIVKDELVRKLVKGGVLNGKRSVREILDEAHVIVDKLIDHSLLLFDKDGDIHMNGLVRNMAWHIWKHTYSHHVMVKHSSHLPLLTEIHHLREWTIDLDTVSFNDNYIGEIPEGTSPNCPRLSTLILCYNRISHIPESFFTHMTALTLLDLSNNPTLACLPNTLSNLNSLTSLVLRGCSKLKYIPPLGQLQALSTLDISRCSIDQVPEGLQDLINLKWLDLSANQNPTMITVSGVLSGLTNMQYLDLSGCSGIKFEDVQGMTMLQYFAASFLDSDSYNHYVQEIQYTGYGFETNLIHFGKFNHWEYYESAIYSELKHVTVRFGDCEESLYLLPRGLAKLSILDNKQWVCLCSALSPDGSFYVKDIHIWECTKLKSLFCLSFSCSLCTNIRNLEHLSINYVESLTSIGKEDVVDLRQSLSQSGVFSHLRKFNIGGCHGIETLLRPELVPQLQNLESISVVWCRSMKEIFGVSSSSSYDNGFSITLRKLTTLELYHLPDLKIVCRGILICGSKNILRNIRLCPKLEELPEIQLA